MLASSTTETQDTFKPEDFSLDTINRAYVKFYRQFGHHPNYISVGPHEYEIMQGFACNVFKVIPSQPVFGVIENTMDKFRRLLTYGIFCVGGIVMGLYVTDDLGEPHSHFSLEAGWDYQAGAYRRLRFW